jgi:RES domain-containing protein
MLGGREQLAHTGNLRAMIKRWAQMFEANGAMILPARF